MKILVLLWFVVAYGWGGVITPSVSVKTSSPVLDFIVRGTTVWAATAGGEALEIDARGKVRSKVALAPITNYWGEKTAPKIMSIDLSPDGKTLVMAAEDGYLYSARNAKALKTAFSTKSVVKKVAFISNTKVMIALLSNEIVFFDLASNKTIKTLSGGTSPLSDMALSKDRQTAAIAGEAGIVSLIDTRSGRIVKHLSGGNVDNIYKLDFQNSRIITAGQDRRAIIYTAAGAIAGRYDGTFLIYSAALSPSAARAAVVFDEQNTITLIDTAKRRTIALAKGHGATLNRIVFVNEKRFVSCADENKILFWEIP